MSSTVEHRGRVIAVTPTLTTVEIISESACSSCHAKGLCGFGESKIKEIQIPTSGWNAYAPGDEVSVVLKASMGHKAVWVAYVLPLCIMMAAILVTSVCGAEELVSGLCGIAAVAIYYACIWLLRDRLRDEYTFNIKK